ncbi:MAG: hypothetical protein K0R49_1249, partial [Burkholderiales bacterium]|nr:hypothetical protein [Burkholderiales bacterium]
NIKKLAEFNNCMGFLGIIIINGEIVKFYCYFKST